MESSKEKDDFLVEKSLVRLFELSYWLLLPEDARASKVGVKNIIFAFINLII